MKIRKNIRLIYAHTRLSVILLHVYFMFLTIRYAQRGRREEEGLLLSLLFPEWLIGTRYWCQISTLNRSHFRHGVNSARWNLFRGCRIKTRYCSQVGALLGPNLGAQCPKWWNCLKKGAVLTGSLLAKKDYWGRSSWFKMGQCRTNAVPLLNRVGDQTRSLFFLWLNLTPRSEKNYSRCKFIKASSDL